jgi:hypothetical protein
MTARFWQGLAAPLLLLALCASWAHAATSVTPLTPLRQSVAGGESQVFSVRFTDAAGRPAAHEIATFSNDACGTFQNGQFAIGVRTDNDGVASATFTARPQGIVCWITASAGVSFTYTVLTYLPANVGFAASLSPPEPKPGQPFSVTVSPRQGLYPIYNHDVSARIVPGTASATLARGSANTAQEGSVTFDVTPDARVGDYEIELRFRERVQRLPVRASAKPWQDMWWSGAAENGWGLSLVQHGDVLFSVLYAYDAAGKPIWYVMPGGHWNDGKTVYSGPLYLPRGSPYAAYDRSKLAVGEPVGTASLAFGDPARVALDYSIDGVAGRKMIERQAFGPADTYPTPALGDMWWGGPEQNGWGIAVLQQYRTLFSAWFTYDASGAPTWYVMPSGYWSDAGTYEGRIFRTTGSPWLGRVYDRAALKYHDVGAFRMRFAGDNASFEYVIEGQAGAMPLTRQPF